MPTVSKKQSRKLWATKGKKWMKKHHMDNSTKGLPEYVGTGKKKASKRRTKGKKK